MFGVNWKQYMKNCGELRMHKKGKHKTGVDAISSLSWTSFMMKHL